MYIIVTSKNDIISTEMQEEQKVHLYFTGCILHLQFPQKLRSFIEVIV